MKKHNLLKLILVSILLIVPILTIVAPYVSIAADNSDLLAQVQIRDDLKPGFAADVTLPEGVPRAQGANAIMQLLAGGLIYIAGPIGVLMLAAGGFQYVISRGDQTQMEAAKKTITYAIIGLLVIILSWAIITNIIWIALQGGQTGTDIPTTTGGTEGMENTTGGTTGGGGETVNPNLGT